MAIKWHRDEKGRYLPGVSGNPNGRPKGLRNISCRMIEGKISEHLDGYYNVLRDKAMSGDMAALNIVMARAAPPRKDAPIELELPPFETLADLPKITAAILKAVSEGDISPSEADALTKMVSAHRQALETVELEQRIAALESRS